MKAEDLKPCKLCGKGVMHAGVPLFYRVRVEHMGVDLQAAQRTVAMETYFGGAVGIARAFVDPDIASRIGEEVVTLVCQACALEPNMLARLAEES